MSLFYRNLRYVFSIKKFEKLKIIRRLFKGFHRSLSFYIKEDVQFNIKYNLPINCTIITAHI